MNPMMMGRLPQDRHRRQAQGHRRRREDLLLPLVRLLQRPPAARRRRRRGRRARQCPEVHGSAACPRGHARRPGGDERPLVAAARLEDAQMEHASVAAFARAALELMAVGPPRPSCCAGCAEAGLDEVRHAQGVLRAGGRVRRRRARAGSAAPGAAAARGGLVALACDTFREGCVGETIAALTALRGRRGRLRGCGRRRGLWRRSPRTRPATPSSPGRRSPGPSTSAARSPRRCARGRGRAAGRRLRRRAAGGRGRPAPVRPARPAGARWSPAATRGQGSSIACWRWRSATTRPAFADPATRERRSREGGREPLRLICGSAARPPMIAGWFAASLTSRSSPSRPVPAART